MVENFPSIVNQKKMKHDYGNQKFEMLNFLSVLRDLARFLSFVGFSGVLQRNRKRRLLYHFLNT
jgi:hypothetical protein